MKIFFLSLEISTKYTLPEISWKFLYKTARLVYMPYSLYPIFKGGGLRFAIILTDYFWAVLGKPADVIPRFSEAPTRPYLEFDFDRLPPYVLLAYL
jgi:hypothetical protein